MIRRLFRGRFSEHGLIRVSGEPPALRGCFTERQAYCHGREGKTADWFSSEPLIAPVCLKRAAGYAACFRGAPARDFLFICMPCFCIDDGTLFMEAVTDRLYRILNFLTRIQTPSQRKIRCFFPAGRRSRGLRFAPFAGAKPVFLSKYPQYPNIIPFKPQKTTKFTNILSVSLFHHSQEYDIMRRCPTQGRPTEEKTWKRFAATSA